MGRNINQPVPGVKEFYPLNEPSIGTPLSSDTFPRNNTLPALFKPLTIRGLTIPNRIFVSPMCQYSSDDGHATDWHLVHIGGFATRGAGGIILEATAVVPEGRISPEDAGLWTDSQIAPLKRIVDFAHTQAAKVGVQLAHAGRKASTLATWVRASADRTHRANRSIAFDNENGWPDNVYGPANVPWSKGYPTPKEMTESDLQHVENAFVAATVRSALAGFDFIEIHGAHGYLLHSFLSPLTNTRKDAYGGQSFENRTRFVLRVVKAVRAAWGERPLFVRLSATDWAEGPEKDPDDGRWLQWGVEQTILLAGELKDLGVDLIDVSSGGNWAAQKIPVTRGYQVPFAEAVKRTHPDIAVGAVGMITTPRQANDVVAEGKADIVLLAREFLRDPHFVLRAASELGVAVKPAAQYELAWPSVLARL
ncbi:NADH:flavin oxidoreductase 2 [Russula earlei]|uniref:NADH:flavin oxidoreductase 2 n=1 Tax=Russula earlei TaxID=71964 RepID=A0ACC0U7G2_9AGAM|nr:NADH:flavin oxidoreductase 2 [Russula earlei]